MKQKNIYWIAAGLLNLLTFFAHLIGGQMELVEPLLDSALSIEVQSQWMGAWHAITIILLATSIVFLISGFKNKLTSNCELISFITYLNLAFCLPFVFSGFHFGMLVPQWIFFLPMGILGILGIRKHKLNGIRN